MTPTRRRRSTPAGKRRRRKQRQRGIALEYGRSSSVTADVVTVPRTLLPDFHSVQARMNPTSELHVAIEGFASLRRLN